MPLDALVKPCNRNLGVLVRHLSGNVTNQELQIYLPAECQLYRQKRHSRAFGVFARARHPGHLLKTISFLCSSRIDSHKPTFSEY
jgi:hypothetical protein